MAAPDADFLYRLANVVLGASSLVIGTLIIVAIGRRPARRLEPVTVVFGVLFLATGVRGCLRAVAGSVNEFPPGLITTAVGVDFVAALAGLAFLAFHRRFGVFVEGVDIV